MHNGKLEEPEDFKCGFFVNVSSNRNRSAVLHDLLSYNSLYVGQKYEEKSFALRIRDLICFNTDLQTVNYFSTNHCQLIYFLNKA